MFGSVILDVAIGLIFVYLILSLIASAIQELIQSVLKTRSAQLEKGIRELLHDPGGIGLAKSLYQHPLIAGLYKGVYDPTSNQFLRRYHLPSYIPARSFAVALLDLVARGRDLGDDSAAAAAAPPISLETVRLSLHRIQ